MLPIIEATAGYICKKDSVWPKSIENRHIRHPRNNGKSYLPYGKTRGLPGERHDYLLVPKLLFGRRKQTPVPVLNAW